MTDAEQGAALLRGVLAAPDDDLPRLVYADWLDENGQSERAEFVRLQVALAAHERALAEHTGPGDAWLKGYMILSRRTAAEKRCREILGVTVTKEDLLAETFPGEAAYRAQCRAVSRYREWVGPAVRIVPTSAMFHDHITFRRGFVEKIRCTLDAWRSHGESIVASHPIQSVRLTDKMPARVGEAWMWTCDVDGASDDLPEDLFALIDRRPTEGLGFRSVFFPAENGALDALSVALLALG